MKILETQSAVLSNYEVLRHLIDMQARYERQSQQKRKPNNLETIMTDLKPYLWNKMPHSTAEMPVDARLRAVMERLSKYELTQAEVLMILNLRPQGDEALEPIIEEKDTRFSKAELQDISAIIRELLTDGSSDESAADMDVDKAVVVHLGEDGS